MQDLKGIMAYFKRKNTLNLVITRKTSQLKLNKNIEKTQKILKSEQFILIFVKISIERAT